MTKSLQFTFNISLLTLNDHCSMIIDKLIAIVNCKLLIAATRGADQ